MYLNLEKRIKGELVVRIKRKETFSPGFVWVKYFPGRLFQDFQQHLIANYKTAIILFIPSDVVSSLSSSFVFTLYLSLSLSLYVFFLLYVAFFFLNF